MLCSLLEIRDCSRLCSLLEIQLYLAFPTVRAIMSSQPFGTSHDGSRAKSALPNPPSWMVSPPPPLDMDQASSTTRPCASITCTVGQMSTRVDFANIQDFDRYGIQILQQAHLASMCMAAPSTAPPVNLQMMQSRFSSAASIVPVSNMSH